MSMSERPKQVAAIQLVGVPYRQEVVQEGESVTVDCNASLDTLAQNAGYEASLPGKIAQASSDLAPLTEGGGYYGIVEAMGHGRDLSFEETFSLITFVCAALNNPLARELGDKIQNLGPQATHLAQANSLLSRVSAKESYTHLTAEEIAGMAAATIHLDTVERTRGEGSVIAFGGMGGDLGYPRENGAASKLFSLSTLASLALAVDGPTHKHHSYPNTSKVAGQSAIEAVGARSDFHSPEAFQSVLNEVSLIMSSCHNTRTLHTLSHLLRGETVNHVIGPLAFTMHPETPLHGFIGVNEKVHPQTVIDALTILNDRGYQRYDNSAVYCGTDLTNIPEVMFDPASYYESQVARTHVRLDEIAPPPYASLVAFSVGGKNAGSYQIDPEDFYSKDALENISFDQLLIPNVAEEILANNAAAIAGRDLPKAMYLAMTVGLGIFTRKYLNKPGALDPSTHRVNRDYLRAATAEGLEVIMSGKAVEKLGQYIGATQRHAGDKQAELVAA